MSLGLSLSYELSSSSRPELMAWVWVQGLNSWLKFEFKIWTRTRLVVTLLLYRGQSRKDQLQLSLCLQPVPIIHVIHTNWLRRIENRLPNMVLVSSNSITIWHYPTALSYSVILWDYHMALSYGIIVQHYPMGLLLL